MTGTLLMPKDKLACFEDIVEEWLGSLSANTRLSYEPKTRAFFEQVGEKRIAELTPADLHQFNLHLQETVSAVNTRRAFQIAVRSLLQFAAQRRLVDPSLPGNLSVESLPKASQLPVLDSIPTIALDRVLAFEQDARNQLILFLAVELGCSVNEIERLNWENINWDDRMITVSSRDRVSRTILIYDHASWTQLMRLLKAYEPQRKGQLRRMKGALIRSHRHGSSLDYSQIYRIVQRALLGLGLDMNVLASLRAEKRPVYLIG